MNYSRKKASAGWPGDVDVPECADRPVQTPLSILALDIFDVAGVYKRHSIVVGLGRVGIAWNPSPRTLKAYASPPMTSGPARTEDTCDTARPSCMCVKFLSHGKEGSCRAPCLVWGFADSWDAHTRAERLATVASLYALENPKLFRRDWASACSHVGYEEGRERGERMGDTHMR